MAPWKSASWDCKYVWDWSKVSLNVRPSAPGFELEITLAVTYSVQEGPVPPPPEGPPEWPFAKETSGDTSSSETSKFGSGWTLRSPASAGIPKAGRGAKEIVIGADGAWAM